MTRSMTAYAAAERSTAWGTLGCELRAVNHRFLELGTRLPDELRALEPTLREQVSARVTRGKLDLVFRLRSEAAQSLGVNEAALEQLAALAQSLQDRFPGLTTDVTGLLQLPGVLQTQAVDGEGLKAEALALLEEVLTQFLAARQREGDKLATVIAERVAGIARIVGEVRTMVPEIRQGLRARLEARVADLAQPLEPGRLEQELVLWLQKLDVDEELDRLDSHIEEIGRVLVQDGPVGRRLDFLLQEFNREANTLGSKSVDRRTSQAAVELKVLIDQIREQVQNLE
ncbi:MAG TPA: YicC family protein [Candidatus Luteimonas excrementigallinarum]|nr:YicC family protein [Candidatus Luteimonas excrementigallinarum]